MNSTIEAILTAYLQHKVQSTHSRHAQHVRALRRWFGQYQPQEITPTVIRAWRANRSSVKDSSIRRELGALVAGLKWGQRHKMFDANNMPVIDLPPPGQAKQVWMNTQQEEYLYASALTSGKATRLFTALALDTAARKSAILRLTWERVDLNAGLIDYREPGMRKTNKRRIPVPINSRLLPILREAWAVAPRDSAGQATGLVVGSRNIDRAFRDFAREVGLSWVTPHVCRHTWACLAAQAGMPMFHIARMLGDTLKTVEDNYAHLAPNHLRQVADWRFAPKATAA